MDKMNIYEKLMNIQSELKAPKNQRNNFGNYNYRSCEDILESVKPLLNKYRCTLSISDEIQYVGDRYYIKARAQLINLDETESIENTAYARESLEKKGMDDSQITGTASSYARKYALNGLFLIDDTKDADTNEYHRQTKNEPPKAQQDEHLKLAQRFSELAEVTGLDREKVYAKYKVKSNVELSDPILVDLITAMEKKAGK